MIQNPYLKLLLMFLDFLFRFFPKRNQQRPVHKILICNGAHLGDVILSTAIITPLKQAFPNAKLGFLIGSWSEEVLKDHPDIDQLHFIDHWKLNRTGSRRYFTTRKQALKEIKSYDLAIDLYPYFPNNAYLLWQAKIPKRIGYISGGCGRLYTHPVTWQARSESIASHYCDLLRVLDIDTTPFSYNLKRTTTKQKTHLIFHTGSGNLLKQWPEIKWRTLAEKYAPTPIYFTGKGGKEKESIYRITKDLPHAFNLCDKLTWQDLSLLVQSARAVVTIDSAMSHLAAAYHIPSVVLFTGLAPIHYWKPLSPHSFAITHPTTCAPCHLKKGCTEMACIRKISVQEVSKQLNFFLN